MVYEGIKFKVPTKEDFLNNGWEEVGPYDSDRLKHTLDVYGVDFMLAPNMLEMAGTILTARRVVSFGIWNVDECAWNWPVQDCLEICGPVAQNSVELKCACGRGNKHPIHADYCDLVTGKNSFDVV